MNIFATDKCPIRSAQNLCDTHVVKMAVETAQILCTIQRRELGKKCKVSGIAAYEWKESERKTFKKERTLDVLSSETLDANNYLTVSMYMSTHKNHPSTLWAGSTVSNYNWTFEHFKAICVEYAHRYKKKHLSSLMLPKLKNSPNTIKKFGLTQFVPAMHQYPDCIVENNPIESYRNYYKLKQTIMKKSMVWTNRARPTWFEL